MDPAQGVAHRFTRKLGVVTGLQVGPTLRIGAEEPMAKGARLELNLI